MAEVGADGDAVPIVKRWSPAQVADLAPDPSSLAAARKLARPGPWSELGSTESLVWGKCQGSGRTPYQASVDLTGPAFRCSCPSRKFPCKHGLALLLLWVDGSGSVSDVEVAADFAEQWAAERSARNVAQSAADRPVKAVDPAAADKRRQARLILMSDGMDDFSRWLTDFARAGLAAARQQPYAWWDATAARLVDAQLSGVADDVRAVGGEVNGRPDWTLTLLSALGRWWTTTRAWAARDTLDPGQLGDLRAYLGWSVSTESVRTEAQRQHTAVADRWLVLGAHQSDDGRLQQQRTWLRGSVTGHTVQMLEFAANGQFLPVARRIGSALDATVALYPGRGIRRALFVDEPAVAVEPVPLPPGTDLESAGVAVSALQAANPWSQRAPVLLADVCLGLDRDGAGSAYVERFDGVGSSVPVTDDVDLWSLLALTGGAPSTVFGELEGSRLRPLTVLLGDELVSV